MGPEAMQHFMIGAIEERPIQRTELLKNDQYYSAFLLQSVYESLKLSAYQQHWRLTIGPLLKLCGKWTLKRTSYPDAGL